MTASVTGVSSVNTVQVYESCSCSLDQLSSDHVYGEVELSILLTAAREVVKAPEVLPQVHHVKPGLFLDFTNQGHVQRFTGLDFTAGQLKNATHEIIFGPLK